TTVRNRPRKIGIACPSRRLFVAERDRVGWNPLRTAAHDRPAFVLRFCKTSGSASIAERVVAITSDTRARPRRISLRVDCRRRARSCQAGPFALGDFVPYYQRLIEWLVLAPHRLNSAGQMELTVAEAATLRACDFVTAAPGRWKIPPLPRDLVRAY